jgi:hypothetical protein
MMLDLNVLSIPIILLDLDGSRYPLYTILGLDADDTAKHYTSLLQS